MDQSLAQAPTLVEPARWRARNGAPVTDRYEILAEIARGGMGVIYRARHRQLDKDVAIKITLPGAPVDRFLREARLLAKINSPHVVAVHDFDVLDDDSPMLVLQWIDGRDLGRLHRDKRGALTEAQVLVWMRQVAEGMFAAAEVGIIHRDLKPSNILIADLPGQASRALVVDFGLARGPVDLGEMTHLNALMGTPTYMAPEQAETPRSVDTRADIYSFGATFYHVLTGHVPFEGESAFSILFKHKTEPLVAPRARNPGLSERTSAVLERCLAKSPSERFSSFAELQQHLAPSASSSPWEEQDDPELARYLARYQQRRDVYLNHPNQLGEGESYAFPGGRTLRVLHGDITRQAVDAIVSSDDQYLSMGGGVSRALREAAGSEFLREQTEHYVPVRPGRVVVTPAGQLGARFIFHAITLAVGSEGVLWPSRDLILEILHACFFHADSLYVKSMALPLLGTGVGRFSREVCLDTLFRFLSRLLLRGLTSVRDVRVVLFG